MGIENVSLGKQEPENDTDNFGRSSLEGPGKNWIMKCYGRWEATRKYINNVYILRSNMLMSSRFVDTTPVFEHL